MITSVIHGISLNCNDADKEKIDLEKENVESKEHPPERSLFNVETYIYRSSNILEVNLFNVGIASISVTNSIGELIYVQSVGTDFPIVLHCPLSSFGDNYFIEISSSRINAVGCFEIY